jgi:hypothetical protein
VLVGNIEAKESLEGLAVNEGIIMGFLLKQWKGRAWIVLIWLRIRPSYRRMRKWD